MIDEIKNLIVAAGIGTFGTDLFIGDIPLTPDNAIMILPSTSEAPDLYLDTQYYAVDFWCRNVDTTQARAKLEAIFALFNRRASFSSGSYEVYFAHATGNIEDMERDAENRKLYRLPFRFIYHSLNNIS